MAIVTCPLCGSPVRLRQFFDRGNKPFCSQCGWNLDRAEAALGETRSTLKFMIVAVLGVGVFAAFAALRSHDIWLLFLPGLFALVALAPLWNYLATRKAINSAKAATFPAAPKISSPGDPQVESLRSVPRPRRVRVEFQGTLALITVLVALIFLCLFPLVLSTWHDAPLDSRNSALIPIVFLSAIILVMVIPIVMRKKKNWPLLRDGEVALGRVTAQRKIYKGKTSYMQIDFEFRINTGQLITNTQTDLTERVFEYMIVPVFYDPLDPSRNTALCSTYLRVSDSAHQ